MILFDPVVEILAGAVLHAVTQHCLDGARIAVMPVRGDPCRRHAGDRSGGTKERFRRRHVPLLAETHVHQRSGTVDRPVEITPASMDLDVGFIDIPGAADPASPAAAKMIDQRRCELRLPVAHRLKPHKVRYYLERRDPEFEARMSEVLCVYQEVAILRAVEANAAEGVSEAAAAAVEQTAPNVAFVSYDEKPGIQAISNTAPDLPPVAGKHDCVARDHEYKRHGTLSLLAGIDLLTGQIHACVEDRHRSREFIGFLKRLDAAYSADTAIKVILDNHSAHVSKETKKWLAAQREGRFSFVFTPKHGSWLNLVEGFFSKMARSVLRHIRVASKAELKQRIMAYLDDLNRQPVVHTWSYKITLPAR